MFYVKSDSDDLPIRWDTVFCRCSNCGEECHADLEELFCVAPFRFDGVTAYCENCLFNMEEEKC
jgi:hypothetical protein